MSYIIDLEKGMGFKGVTYTIENIEDVTKMAKKYNISLEDVMEMCEIPLETYTKIVGGCYDEGYGQYEHHGYVEEEIEYEAYYIFDKVIYWDFNKYVIEDAA